MIELFKSSLVIISTIVGIMAGVLFILLTFWKNPFVKPKLYFKFGLPVDTLKNDFTKKQIKLIKQKNISLIAFFPQEKSSKTHIGTMFFSVQNQGKEPLKNIGIMLEYSSDFLVDNKLFKSLICFEPTRQEINKKIVVARMNPFLTNEEIKKLIELRNVNICPGGRAQVYYNIPVVRPGEEFVLYDILAFRKGVIARFESLGISDNGFSHIEKLIRKIDGIDNYLIMNAWIYSENYAKQNKKISIIRLVNRANFNEVLNDFTKALWFGEYPRVGTYFYDPIVGIILRKLKYIGRLDRKLDKEELGLQVDSNNLNIRIKNGDTYTIENVDSEQNTIQYFSIKSPNCDYFYLPSYVDSHDKLLKWLGVTYLPNLFKKKKC